jgi:hypothetical protein
MCAKSAISAKSPLLMCRLASPLPIGPSLSSCSPAACLACAEMCELRELSELSHRDTLFSHQDDQAIDWIILPSVGDLPNKMCAESMQSAQSFFSCAGCRAVLSFADRGGFCSGKRRCPVVYSKLSKLLHQEDALGAPFLGCDCCSPQALPRGAGMLRTGVIRRFRVTFTAATPKSSRRLALMLSRWLAAVHVLSAPVQGQTGPSLRRR